MKKYLILILIVLIFGTLVVGVQAAGGKLVDAQRVPLYPVDNRSSNNVLTSEPSQGEVVFVDPMGNVTLVIQGNVEGLTPKHEYAVWVRNLSGYTGLYLDENTSLGYYKLETFTTNVKGKGKFHINILANDLPTGEYEIQLAINDCEAGGTDLATIKYITVTIKE